ncbi:hypothetical protein D9757_014358 [Collybiopsis confluens]|uniref:VASt domain-containing protein n=1 Tax=Collybiopsis confluens TaxID=2823264 RepID=A0A8H5CS02_9AGAR|nr:hypothetical protein D9757_014358 [Collybiopsis confluens]
MAPNFLSKLVRNPSGHHTRDRSDPSGSGSGKSRTRSPSPSPASSSTNSVIKRARAFSSSFTSGNNSTTNTSPSPSPSEFGALGGSKTNLPIPPKPRSRAPSIKTENVTAHGQDNTSDTSSFVNTNFTIVPPSPRKNALGLDGLPPGLAEGNFASIIDGLPVSGTKPANFTRFSPSSSPSSSKKLTKSRPTTPTSSTVSLPRATATGPPPPPLPSLPTEKVKEKAQKKQEHEAELLPSPELSVRKMSSNRSLNLNIHRPASPNGVTTNGSTNHLRSATVPVYHAQAEVDDMTPIVESPTSESPPPADDIPATKTSAGNNPSISAFLTASPQRDSDAASIRSTYTTNTSPTSKKKEPSKPWRRQPSSKPTGLASAIAASGLAMANPTFSVHQQAQLSTPAIQATLARVGTNASAAPGRKPSLDGNSMPYMLGRTGSSSAGATSSTQFSPPRSSRSSKSRRSSIGSSAGKQRKGGHRPSFSIHSDNGTDVTQTTPQLLNPDGYYSGLDSSDEEDDEDGSSDDEDDEDDLASALDVHDMPVTGFAVASSRRNADFHEMFKNIPEGDYLIEDYGCALQREILIQGRLYISENHICFHANILGWITDLPNIPPKQLSIPIDEIISLEKKMTAFVIPNAIQMTTRQAKYTFASFLSRDTTFDVIFNIWRLVKPENGTLSPVSDNASIASGSREGPGGLTSHVLEGTIIGDGTSGGGGGGEIGALGGSGAAAVQNKVTYCKCGKEGKHYTEVAMNTVIPGTPEKIHNLMFTSGFIKDFLVGNQKLMELQMSDWSPGTDNHLSRTMSYIKPLTGAVGPRQTKCEIRDEVENLDFLLTSPNAYSSTLTTTRTPDVPSGSAFSIKTRTCITYASSFSSRVVITSQVEWTGRSFIKGLIERGAIDGQKTYHVDLEKAMRGYIQEHQTEFVPEGTKLDVVVAPPTGSAVNVVGGGAGAGTGTGGAGGGAAGAGDVGANANGDASSAGAKHSQRGLQWAWETFEGAMGVAKTSTEGALELLGDILPSISISNTPVLYLIIFGLVLSNMWTWMRVPNEVVLSTSSGVPGGTRKQLERWRTAEKERIEREREREARILKEEREDRERWIHGVVTALWDELAAGKGPLPVLPVGSQLRSTPQSPKSIEDVDLEIKSLSEVLGGVEDRVKEIKQALVALRPGDEGAKEKKKTLNDVD